MTPKRSPSRFLIVSGAYLFLIVLLNSTQPRSGYAPDMGMILLWNLFFLPVWAGIAFIAMWCRKVQQKNGGKELVSAKFLFGMLVISVIAGFLLNTDYQRQEGCFVEDEPFLSPLKCIISGSSLALLSLGYAFSNKKAGILLLILEFIFWTLKALLYFNCSLDPVFTGYFTVICWTLRLVLILKLNAGNQRAAHVPA